MLEKYFGFHKYRLRIQNLGYFKILFYKLHHHLQNYLS